MMKNQLIIFGLSAFMLFAFGCRNGGVTVGVNSGADDEKITGFRSLGFMTYNIWGTGSSEYGGMEDDRLFWVLDLVEMHSVDVVGIQEVWWSSQDTLYQNFMTIADSVGALLDMETWAPRPDWDGAANVLLSRLEILDQKILRPPTDRSILKATLLDDYGEPWIVYVMHLLSDSQVSPSLSLGQGLFIKDHIPASSDTLSAVHQSTTLPIDQVWISGDLEKVERNYWLDLYASNEEKMDSASDHHPVTAMVVLPK